MSCPQCCEPYSHIKKPLTIPYCGDSYCEPCLNMMYHTFGSIWCVMHPPGNKNHQHRKTSFKSQLWRGIRLNTRNLFKELLFSIPLLLLKFIPGVNIFSAILLLLIQAYYTGFGNIDYTLERHFKYKESIAFVRKNKGLAIGNGLVFMLFLFIPIIGIIIVLPLSVTAATTKTVELIIAENEQLATQKTPIV